MSPSEEQRAATEAFQTTQPTPDHDRHRAQSQRLRMEQRKFQRTQRLPNPSAKLFHEHPVQQDVQAQGQRIACIMS